MMAHHSLNRRERQASGQLLSQVSDEHRDALGYMPTVLIHREDIGSGRLMIGQHGLQTAVFKIRLHIPSRPQDQPMPIQRETERDFPIIARQRPADLV